MWEGDSAPEIQISADGGQHVEYLAVTLSVLFPGWNFRIILRRAGSHPLRAELWGAVGQGKLDVCSSSLSEIAAFTESTLWLASGGSTFRKPLGRAGPLFRNSGSGRRFFWGEGGVIHPLQIEVSLRSARSNASVFRPTERSILPNSAPAQFTWRLQRRCVRPLGGQRLLECRPGRNP